MSRNLTNFMEPIIVGKNLIKQFDGLTAVNSISFEVQKGECFGFLGPNGAGKSTTLKMIYGFSPPTGGELSVFGLSVINEMRAIKRRIGVAPQEMSLDPDLTVIQNLTIYGSYFDIPKKTVRERVNELLTFFHLIDKKNEKIDRLSGGMKRRLLTARALMNKPDLLVLDEPTTGLDPQSRHVMWDRLRDLRSQGVTTLVTTHYMEEAEVLCDRIVVIDHGKIIDEGNPKMLIQKYEARNLEEVFLKLTGRELRD